jgi:hypothetical protein
MRKATGQMMLRLLAAQLEELLKSNEDQQCRWFPTSLLPQGAI